MAGETASEPVKRHDMPSRSPSSGTPGMSDTPTRTRSEGEPRRYSRGRVSRGKGLRNTAGCLTCRRRHVKCDEGKPRCGPCAKRRVSCAYATAGDRTKTPRAPSPGVSNAHSPRHNGQVSAATPAEPMRQSRRERTRSRDIDHEDDNQTTGTVQIVATDAHWAETPSAYVGNSVIDVDRAINLGEDRSATGQYEYHGIENDHVNPPIPPSAVGTSSYHSMSLAYGRSPGAAVPYQTHTQFTGYPGIAVDSPTARWLDLLIGDATVDNGPLPDWEYDSNGLDVFGNSVAQSPVSNSASLSLPVKAVAAAPHTSRQRNPFSATSCDYLKERTPYVGNQKREELAWKAIEPVELQKHETILLRHYAEHISRWMDLFDPHRPFGTLVPHLAMHSVGLMNAILALSARHLSIIHSDKAPYAEGYSPGPNDAVDYYLKTLHYSQRAMQYDTYKTSLELLAISLIVSSYEMLGGSTDNWGKHLEGVFWIQRSQVIHGDTGGLRQAVWWAWLCQDVWAAFREKRKPFTFWSPSRMLAELTPVEIATRSVYNYAKVVGFCSRDAMANGRDVAARTLEADVLLRQLDEWRTFLTLEFNPLPMGPGGQGSAEEIFPPVWIQPAIFAVSMQIYYCSLILVHLQRPMSGGLDDHLERRSLLGDCTRMVCGIARTLTDSASSIMSSQCLFIAGMVLEDEKQRQALLELLEDCKKRGGWPSHSLGDDLSQIWKRSG